MTGTDPNGDQTPRTTAAAPHDSLAPLILLGDEPVPGFAEDDLGLGPFARVVAGAALGSPGPFTIGVFAEWGLGKTSALKIAKSLIDRDRRAPAHRAAQLSEARRSAF